MFNIIKNSSVSFVLYTYFVAALTLLIVFPAQAQESAGGARSGYRLSVLPDRTESDIDVTRWIGNHISTVDFQSLSQDDARTEQDRSFSEDDDVRPSIGDLPPEREIAAVLVNLLVGVGVLYLEARQEELHGGFGDDRGTDPWDEGPVVDLSPIWGD